MKKEEKLLSVPALHVDLNYSLSKKMHAMREMPKQLLFTCWCWNVHRNQTRAELVNSQHLYCLQGNCWWKKSRCCRKILDIVSWMTFFLHFPKPSCFTNPGMHRKSTVGFILFFIIETFFPRDILKTVGRTEEKWKMLTSSLWDFFIQVK